MWFFNYEPNRWWWCSVSRGKKYFFFNKAEEPSAHPQKTIGKAAKPTKKQKKEQQKVAKAAMGKGVFGFAAWQKSEQARVREEESSSRSPGLAKYTNHNSNYETERYLTKQPVVDIDNVISTAQGPFEVMHSEAWGSALIPVEDPRALSVTPEDITNFKLQDNFPKIPKILWARWMKLVFYYCEQKEKAASIVAPINSPPTQFIRIPNEGAIVKVWNSPRMMYDFYRVLGDNHRVKIENPLQELGPSSYYGYCSGGVAPMAYQSSYSYEGPKELEVTALLCRKADDLSQWKIVIPRQTVSRGAVYAPIDKTIDIETGEQYPAFPPDGWLHAGSTHSHNTMSAFFSKVDDESELSVPGLHIVVGQISRYSKTYEAKASIVLRHTRKFVPILDVVDAESDPDAQFHTNALEQISEKAYGIQSWEGSEDSEFAWLREEARPESAIETKSFPLLPLIGDQTEPSPTEPSPKPFEDEGGWAWGGL